MQYYGTRLSENISRREPEGYLLCLNVPVARTGVQEYLPEELGLPSAAAGEGPSLVPVRRPPEEVFSPETLASFEGMPVTNDHPPDGVDIDNIRRLQAGHAHNIRRGTGDESDLLLADLIITDPRLIEAVLAGKREISCGYTYELHLENGKYIQRKIRGNHIAVVDAGRAGSRVSIKDHMTERSPEKMKKPVNKPLLKLLARMAMDDEEAVAEVLEAMLEESPAEAAPAEEPAENPGESTGSVTVEVPENREITIDEGALTAVTERLDTLISLISASLQPAPAADGDPAEEIAEIVEETLEAVQAENPAGEEETASVTLEESGDCGDPGSPSAQDAIRAAVLTFRPVLEQLSPAQRRKASAEIAANMGKIRKSRDAGIYAGLAAGARSRKKDLSALGKSIMEKHNVNYAGK